MYVRLFGDSHVCYFPAYACKRRQFLDHKLYISTIMTKNVLDSCLTGGANAKNIGSFRMPAPRPCTPFVSFRELPKSDTYMGA